METYYPGFETPTEEPADKIGIFNGIRYEERFGMPGANALATAGGLALLPLAASFGMVWILLLAVVALIAVIILARVDPLNYRWWQDDGTYPRTTTSASGVMFVMIPLVVAVLAVVSGEASLMAGLIFGAVIFALSLYYFRKLIPWRHQLENV